MLFVNSLPFQFFKEDASLAHRKGVSTCFGSGERCLGGRQFLRGDGCSTIPRENADAIIGFKSSPREFL
jgi:hypothetical protein